MEKAAIPEALEPTSRTNLGQAPSRKSHPQTISKIETTGKAPLEPTSRINHRGQGARTEIPLTAWTIKTAASGNLRLCLKLLSCWKDMEYGAPQGSIPGSLLFNIRLCDPHCLLEDLDITSYADDTKIYTLKENKESITTLWKLPATRVTFF